MTSAITLPTLPLTVPYLPMRISVERYHEMIRQGIFEDDERCELLDGVLVEKMTKHPLHTHTARKCYAYLVPMILPGWLVISQDPITLSTSEPEPDLAIVRGRPDDFALRHPGASEIELVIEVASSSLVTDRYKANLYAEALIPNYWIINLNERTIEVYSLLNDGAIPGHYGEPHVYRATDSIPLTIAGCQANAISASDLLP